MNTGNIADFLLGVVTPGVVPGADASKAQLPLDAGGPDFASLLDSRVIAAALRDAVLPAEQVVENQTGIAPQADIERPDVRPEDVALDAPAAPPVAHVSAEPAVAHVPTNQTAVPALADDSAPASPVPAPPNATAGARLSAASPELPPQPVVVPQPDGPDAPLTARPDSRANPDAQPQAADKAAPVIHDGEIATRVLSGARNPVNLTEGAPAAGAPAAKLPQQTESPRIPRGDTTEAPRESVPAAKIPVLRMPPADTATTAKPDQPMIAPESTPPAAQPLVRSSRIRRTEFQRPSAEGVTVDALRNAAPQAERIQVTTAAPVARESAPRENAGRAAAKASPNVVVKNSGTAAVEAPVVVADAAHVEPAARSKAQNVITSDMPVESTSTAATRPDMAGMPQPTAPQARPEGAERVALGRASIAPTVDREIADLVRTQGQENGAHKAKIRIHPPELGTVSVELRVHNQRVAVELLVESRDVKMLLNANESGIRASLADQGLSLESFNVGMSHQSHGEQQATQRQTYESTNTATTAEAEAFASAGEPLEFVTDRAVNVFA